MVSLVNSHTNATRTGSHMWEIDLRFAPGLPPGWLHRSKSRRQAGYRGGGEEMGVFAPPSHFFKNVSFVRETEILLEQQTPQGVLVCDHAGLVINKLSRQAGTRGGCEDG